MFIIFYKKLMFYILFFLFQSIFTCDHQRKKNKFPFINQGEERLCKWSWEASRDHHGAVLKRFVLRIKWKNFETIQEEDEEAVLVFPCLRFETRREQENPQSWEKMLTPGDTHRHPKDMNVRDGVCCRRRLQAISNIFEMMHRYKILTVLVTFQGITFPKTINSPSSIASCLKLYQQRTRILIYFMQTSNNSASFKRRYSYISIKKREQLVKSVLEDGKSLSKTSKRLNIRLSTAKLILKKYRLHGRFFMKKTQHRRGVVVRNISEEASPLEIDRQSNIQQKEGTIWETGQQNCIDQMLQGTVECGPSGGYVVYYQPTFYSLGWNGWNLIPVAFLQ